MDYRRLGNSGLRISRIGLGMMSYGDPAWRAWVVDIDQARPIVRHTVDAGVTFFDTANIYSHGRSEEITGQLLRECFSRREDYVLATKVCSPVGPGPNDRGLSRKHILAAIDDSLRRLKTDYVDLYQIHRWDYETPIEETLQTLDELVRSGKVRYIGASSMYAWQFAKAQYTAARHGWTRFISMQNHYNLLYREEEREMLPLCLDLSVGVIPWSPLARGWLTGSRQHDGPASTARTSSDRYAAELYEASDFRVVDQVLDVGKRRRVPPAQVALAWLLAQPAVTAPILGATKPTHVDDALAALDVTLSRDETTQLEAECRPHTVRGHR